MSKRPLEGRTGASSSSSNTFFTGQLGGAGLAVIKGHFSATTENYVISKAQWGGRERGGL